MGCYYFLEDLVLAREVMVRQVRAELQENCYVGTQGSYMMP